MSFNGSPILLREKQHVFIDDISPPATQRSIDLFGGVDENLPSSSQSQTEPRARQRVGDYEIIEDNDDDDTGRLVQRASQMAVSIHSSPERPLKRSRPLQFASQISERSEEHDRTELESDDLSIMDVVSEPSNDEEDEYMVESDVSSDNEVLLNMSKACDTTLTRAPAKKTLKKAKKSGPLSKMFQELMHEPNAELHRHRSSAKKAPKDSNETAGQVRHTTLWGITRSEIRSHDGAVRSFLSSGPVKNTSLPLRANVPVLEVQLDDRVIVAGL